MNHRQLWKKIFGDNDAYIDFYFKERADHTVVYSKYEGHDLVSMIFFNYYTLVIRGEKVKCPYIEGVATAPEWRVHTGYDLIFNPSETLFMKKVRENGGKAYNGLKMLLYQGMMDARNEGAPYAFLSPANEEIYKPFGFQGVYYRKQMEIQGRRHKWYHAGSFSHLDSRLKERAVEFVNAQLYASELDVYIYRDVKYYDTLMKETKTLGGKVVVLRNETMIDGVAVVTHEEDRYEVQEMICAPEDADKVVESLCYYLGVTDDETVLFEDGYFLQNVTGEGIAVRMTEKPYIMARALGDDGDAGNLKWYINDIT